MSGNVFMPMSTVPSSSDPNKHVNYVLGMVLGVDDFNQEFAYLSGRSELAARELGGSGVVRGLRVSSVLDALKGPEIVVSAGVAVSPQGRFVRVPLTQCAVINDWIAKNRADKLKGVAPPATVPLYVVLSYRERTTDLVPIPGEPCRTEDQAMADSRVEDDFCLELRTVPPERREEDARRQYLTWLLTVPVVESGAPALDAFLKAIADAAAKAPKPVVPAGGGPPNPLPAATPIFDVPPALSVPRSLAAVYFRAAIQLFASLRGVWLGAGASADGTPPNETALLLAKLQVPIVLDALDNNVWKVASAPPIVIDEIERSQLLPLSYLQDSLFTLVVGASKIAVTHPLGAINQRYVLVAAGAPSIKDKETDPEPPGSVTYNGLSAWASADGEVSLKFQGPNDPSLRYVAKVLPVAGAGLTDATVSFGAAAAGGAPRFTLRVNNAGAAVPRATLVGKQLMVEVSAFGPA